VSSCFCNVDTEHVEFVRVGSFWQSEGRYAILSLSCELKGMSDSAYGWSRQLTVLTSSKLSESVDLLVPILVVFHRHFVLVNFKQLPSNLVPLDRLYQPCQCEVSGSGLTAYRLGSHSRPASSVVCRDSLPSSAVSSSAVPARLGLLSLRVVRPRPLPLPLPLPRVRVWRTFRRVGVPRSSALSSSSPLSMSSSSTDG
jgi:hypothetical protein